MPILKNLFLILFLYSLCFEAQAQSNASVYVVKFTDKNNSPYNISAPLDYLSPRAINRRTNQNIGISTQDFPVNNNYVNQISALGAQILNRSKWLNAVSIYCTDSVVLQNIQMLSFVQGVNPVKRIAQFPLVPKLESDFQDVNEAKQRKYITINSSSSNLNYGASLNQVAMLGGDLLHFAGFKGAGKTIAVIDAGFAIADQCETFDSLFAHNQILGTWDFVSGDSNVYDDHYHGTYVLSTMAGNTPGELIGTAPKASYWLLRSEDAPTENLVEEFNWVCAAEFADSVGVDIINSSLGYTTFDNPLQNHTWNDLNGTTTMISIGADIAAAKGIVVCNSAGNSGDGFWKKISVPADAFNILTVGAVDANEIVAGFSSRGNTADGRIKPDVAAQGVATVGQYQPGVYATGNGTSFSSPLIAGMCASLWEALPDLTAAQLIQKVKESASQYLNPDSLMGYGIPNFAQIYTTVTGKKIEIPPYDSLVSVYPNPFNNQLRATYFSSKSQTLNISIYNVLGEQIISTQMWCDSLHYYQINIQVPEKIAQGLYFLELGTNEKKQTVKLIKE